jgi:hypothetical protein
MTKLTNVRLKRQSDVVDTYAIWDDPIDPKYRYVLCRDWNQGPKPLPHMVVIGLNPSSADEQYDDRTVRRCINFARREGFGSLTMINAFALRATNPYELYSNENPVGPDNDHWIATECGSASKIVVAWGKHGRYKNRQERILYLLGAEKLYCFGKNKDGTPKHPLYLSNSTKLVEF